MTPKETEPEIQAQTDVSSGLTPEQSEMVVKNLKLVHHVLHKHGIHQQNPEYEDYVQEGTLGLILAAQRFDPTRGFSFATFACSYIYGNVRRYMRDYKNVIRIPRTAWDSLGRVKEHIRQSATFEELSELSGLSDSDIQFAFNALHPSSLNTTITNTQSSINNETRSSQLQDVIPDNTYNPEDIVCEEDNIQWAIEQVLKQLHSDLHKSIWEEFIYGAMYDKTPNQIDLAKKYKVSQAQVSRVLRNCLQNFLKALNN